MFEVHKTEIAMRYASLGKIFKFDVLFSGTDSSSCWCYSRPVFLFKHYYMSVEFRHLAFPSAAFDREPGNFTPFMNYNLYSLSVFVHLFTPIDVRMYCCVRGTLKFVVNGFLMQILYIYIKYMANCEQYTFPYPNFHVCFGIVVLDDTASSAVAVAVLFTIEINHSTL